MRLKDFEIDAIKSSVHAYLPEAEIYLFGSRVDDSKRGGDIDLLVYTPGMVDVEFRTQSRIKNLIWDKIGEQKIDMIFTDDLAKTPFISLVMLESVKL